MKKMNKKAGIVSWVVTIATILFLILVFFIFNFLLDLPKDRMRQRVATEVQENQIQINLLNFLRTPVGDDEVIADYIAYAMMEETEEEKKNKNMEYNVPSSYSRILELYNDILLKHYDPDCISLKLEYMDLFGQVIRTRNLGRCGHLDPYSSSITIPIKELGHLIKVTGTSGKASALGSLQFCLHLVIDEWRCGPYTASTGLGGIPCEGVVFDDLSICQTKAEQYNSMDNPAEITPGEILSDIYEEGESLEGWVLCEHFDGFYSQCRCEELISNVQPCRDLYAKIGQSSYSTEEECEEHAMQMLIQDFESDAYPQRCYNYFSRI